MPATPERLGTLGERLAARYLESQGWTIVARNFRVGRREIDLVVHRAGVVAFVEVKTRRGERFGGPLEAITPTKRREIGFAAREWVALHGEAGFVYRFDAVGLLGRPDGSFAIDHLEDAWRLE